MKSPLFVLFSIYPHCKHESDYELKRFAWRVGSAGVDYVRVFSGWEEGPDFVAPFPKTDGKWDLSHVNPEYLQYLRRFRDALRLYGVGILFDFFPSQLCRAGYPFAFWHRDNNVNNVDSVYGTRPHELAHYCAWIKTIFDTIGTEGNLFKFGNEMQAPGDQLDPTGRNNDVNEIKRWAEVWVDTVAKFVRSIGVQGPLSCTCENYAGTGHKISNYLCEPDWGLEWPWDRAINHIHCGTIPAFVEWFKPGTDDRRYSLRKYYAISDDGIGFSGINSVPPERRGTCSSGREWYGSYVGSKCSGDVQFRVEWVRYFQELFGYRLAMVELMPQCHHSSGWKLNDLHQEVDLDCYNVIAREVYGVDVRRSFPEPKQPEAPVPPLPPEPPSPEPPSPKEGKMDIVRWLFGPNSFWKKQPLWARFLAGLILGFILGLIL